MEMDSSHERYMAKIPDMSGSVAKNRFRVELLWGLEKLLECLDEGVSDFAVVFDYCCDIELHLDDSYEFYQVKTSKGKNFGVNWACKRHPTSQISIVGKLYELHDARDDGTVRLVIVGNKPFAKKGGKFDSPGKLLFSALNLEDKQRIEEAIADHLPEVSVNLDLLSYVMVAIDLSNPDNAIEGHLLETYEKTMGCEARKPNALYRALRGLAEERACEERSQNTYEEVIARKAITSDEVKRLFNQYADQENSVYDFVMTWIRKQPPLQQSELICAYEEITRNLYKPRGMKPIQFGIEIMARLDNSMTVDEIVGTVVENLKDEFNLEVTDAMRKVYALIALHEMMGRVPNE